MPSSKDSSACSSFSPLPRDSISLWKVSASFMASSTVLPSTRSTMTDRLAWEMEHPWPSHTSRSMVYGSASETSAWMVASSPQVGLNWCDSPGVQYSWLACTVVSAACEAFSEVRSGAKCSLPCGFFAASRMTSWYICSRSLPDISKSLIFRYSTPKNGRTLPSASMRACASSTEL